MKHIKVLKEKLNTVSELEPLINMYLLNPLCIDFKVLSLRPTKRKVKSSGYVRKLTKKKHLIYTGYEVLILFIYK